MKKLNGDPTLRFRFSSPSSDKIVNGWVSAQRNLSSSLRIVIKEYVARHGFSDVTCLPVSTDDVLEQTVNVAPAVAETISEQTQDGPVAINTEPEQPVPTKPIAVQPVQKPIVTQPVIQQPVQTTSADAADAIFEELMK